MRLPNVPAFACLRTAHGLAPVCLNGTSNFWNTSRGLQHGSRQRRSAPGSSSCCRMMSVWQMLRRRDKGGSLE